MFILRCVINVFVSFRSEDLYIAHFIELRMLKRLLRRKIIPIIFLKNKKTIADRLSISRLSISIARVFSGFIFICCLLDFMCFFLHCILFSSILKQKYLQLTNIFCCKCFVLKGLFNMVCTIPELENLFRDNQTIKFVCSIYSRWTSLLWHSTCRSLRKNGYYCVNTRYALPLKSSERQMAINFPSGEKSKRLS